MAGKPWGAHVARGAVVVAIGLSLAPATASAGPCRSAGARAAEASVGQLSGAVTCLLNHERRQLGLRGLTEHARLRSAARGHATDMVRRRYFAHDSLDGRTFTERIQTAGYMRGQERGPWKVGETLGWASEELSRPEQLVAMLMGSPAHRAVITDGEYRHVGVGIVRGTPSGDRRGATLVVNFGTLAGRGTPAPPPPYQAPAPPAQEKDADRGGKGDDDRGPEKEKEKEKKEKDRGEGDERKDKNDD